MLIGLNINEGAENSVCRAEVKFSPPADLKHISCFLFCYQKLVVSRLTFTVRPSEAYPSARSINAIHQRDPSTRSISAIHQRDPSTRSISAIHQRDPSARSINAIHQRDPSTRSINACIVVYCVLCTHGRRKEPVAKA